MFEGTFLRLYLKHFGTFVETALYEARRTIWVISPNEILFFQLTQEPKRKTFDNVGCKFSARCGKLLSICIEKHLEAYFEKQNSLFRKVFYLRQEKIGKPAKFAFYVSRVTL